MSNIGDLVAYLVADTQKWQAGLSIAKSDLAAFAKTTASSLAAIGASFATVDFASSAIFAAEQDIAAVKKFEAVLASTGGVSGVTADRISELAGELQKLTGYEDDATVSAAAFLATFKNIRGDDFERALRLSQDMATVWDVDLLSAAKKLGKQLKDLPIEEVTEKLSDLDSRFGGTAANAITATKKIELVIGDLKEQIGKELLPAVELFGRAAVPVLDEVNSNIGQTGREAATASDFVQNYLLALTPTTAVIGSWGLLKDAINEVNDATAGVLPNLEKVFVDPAWEEAMQPGKDGAFAEGQMPLFDDMEEQFHEKIRRMQNEIDLLTKSATHAEIAFRDAIAEGFTPEQAKMIEENVRAIDALKQIQKEADDAERQKRLEKPEAKPSERNQGVSALQKGSAEAMSAIFRAGRDDIGKKQLEVEQEQLAQLERAVDSLDAIARRDSSVTLVAGSLA